LKNGGDLQMLVWSRECDETEIWKNQPRPANSPLPAPTKVTPYDDGIIILQPNDAYNAANNTPMFNNFLL
jgi:hypothetical protein